MLYDVYKAKTEQHAACQKGRLFDHRATEEEIYARYGQADGKRLLDGHTVSHHSTATDAYRWLWLEEAM
jgi:hypothetical protein